MKKKRNTNVILVIATIGVYMVYAIFWFHAAWLQSEQTASTSTKLAAQFVKEGTIRNVSELGVYFFFLVYCWRNWNPIDSKKYKSYFVCTVKLFLAVLLVAVIFTAVQYAVIGILWKTYMVPLAIMLVILFAVLLMLSGKDTRIEKEIHQKPLF